MKSPSYSSAAAGAEPPSGAPASNGAPTERPAEGATKRYFCNEPWTGVLAIEVNRNVTFCPCYLKLHLGNLETASLQELWNATPLVEIRRAFSEGRLAGSCRGQLCGPALGAENYLTQVPVVDETAGGRRD